MTTLHFMSGFFRIMVFGYLSGVLWSFVPGILADLVNSRADVPAVLIAGVVSGVATSTALAAVVLRTGRWLTLVSGLLSLPLGAFVFGFSHALVGRLLSPNSGGVHGFPEPWNLGATYALLSVLSVFAVGLFPLAVASTFLLKKFILRGNKAPWDAELGSTAA